MAPRVLAPRYLPETGLCKPENCTTAGRRDLFEEAHSQAWCPASHLRRFSRTAPCLVAKTTMAHAMAIASALLIAVLTGGPELAASASTGRHLLQGYDDTLSASRWKISNGLAAVCGGQTYPASNWGGQVYGTCCALQYF